MPEPESQPIPPDALDGDVDRLLREAEALTREVARETGTPVRDADTLLAGELPVQGDPQAAVDAAASNVMSLEDLLGELGPAASPETAPPSPAAPFSRLRANSNPATSQSPSVPSTSDPATRSKRVELATHARGPRVEHMPTQESEAAGAPPIEGESHDDAAGTQPAGESSPNRTEPSRPPSPPLHRRLLNVARTIVGTCRWVILLLMRDVPVGLLSWFDLPFRRTPRSIKNAIGIIGGITLIMGVLAWALPGMVWTQRVSPAASTEPPATSK